MSNSSRLPECASEYSAMHPMSRGFRSAHHAFRGYPLVTEASPAPVRMQRLRGSRARPLVEQPATAQAAMDSMPPIPRQHWPHADVLSLEASDIDLWMVACCDKYHRAALRLHPLRTG